MRTWVRGKVRVASGEQFEAIDCVRSENEGGGDGGGRE